MSRKLPVRTPTGADTAQAIVDALAFGLSVEAVAELMNTTVDRIMQIITDRNVIAQIEARREQIFNQLDVNRRLKRRALWAVESLVPRLMELGHDPSVPPTARVAAVAELVKISGLREREEANAAIERVVVNIHTGHDTITIETHEPDGAKNDDTDTITASTTDGTKGGDNDGREVQGPQEGPMILTGRVDEQGEVQINLSTPRATRPTNSTASKQKLRIKTER
jgi:hypothetical protein